MEIFDQAGVSVPESSDNELAPDLMSSFIAELGEGIATIEQKIVEIESSPGANDLINDVFRSFHNLKGSSTMVGLSVLPEILHYAESVLDLIRSGKLKTEKKTIDQLLLALSAIREIHNDLRKSSKESGKRYFSVLSALEDLTLKAVENKNTQEKGETAATGGDEQKRSQEDETIKIARPLVEQLMLIVGDFMLVDSSFQFLKKKFGHDWAFTENCQQLGRFSSKLQSTVLRMRLSPIKPIFSSMHRVVRSTASDLQKKVTLDVSGADTLVDRTVLDVIADPLIHMMRNAIDHGIEHEQERIKCGKHPEGRISLSAFHRSGEVLIQVSDDGRGIDPHKIREKAVKKGLMSKDDADRLSDLDAQKIIFLPGFSGAEQITNISGRGVGMDVVKAVVEKLGGHLDLVSSPGSGTTITIRLPLSMAIAECLEFRLGNHAYAVAQVSVEEVFSVRSPFVEGNLHDINNSSRVLNLRKTPMPVIDLAATLDVVAEAQQDQHIIQVRYGSSRFALLVGEVIGPCNIVSQPLPNVFGDAPFSGMTRRGDGTLMYQIDLSKLAAGIKSQTEDRNKDARKIGGGTAITSSDLRRLQQKIAVFKNVELFCVPVHAVKRVVMIERENIHHIDDRSFVTVEGTTIPLIWIEETLLKKERIEASQYSMLIFQIEERSFAIPMVEFKGILRMPTQYDNTMRTDIIIGTTVLDQETCMVIDLFGLAARKFGADIKTKPNQATRIKKIACAEDDPFFREQLLSYLRARDFEVVDFSDGLALKEFLGQPQNAKSIDAVVTDIEMPKLDGLSLIRWIKGNESTKHLPCLVITALTNREVVRLAVSAGASAFVPKMHHHMVLSELKRIESGIEHSDNRLNTSQKGFATAAIKRVVTFTVHNNTYAIPMDQLKDVSHPTPSLPIPEQPAWLSRVTAFRGKMVPVIDLASLFNPSLKVQHLERQQAIVDFQGQVMAVLFDTIGEVVLLSQLVPGFGLSIVGDENQNISEFISGVYQKENQIISLINISAFFKIYEQRRLAAA